MFDQAYYGKINDLCLIFKGGISSYCLSIMVVAFIRKYGVNLSNHRENSFGKLILDFL